MISAREDGFEIDRIMLMKDLSGNTRICEPDGADGIKCVNGSLENVDDVVDMDVSLERNGSDSSELSIDTTIDFSAVVANRDGYDTASDVVLQVQTGAAWQVLSVEEGCSQSDGTITCNLGTVPPSGPEGEQLFDFSLMPMQSGAIAIEAEVQTSSVDGSPGNDTASLALTVTDEDSLSSLTAVLAESASAWVSGSESNLSFTVTNAGPAVADNVDAVVSLPSGVTVTRTPQSCDASGSLVCSWLQLAVGESKTIELGVTPAREGLYSVSLVAEADNLDAGAAELAADSVIVTVTAPDAEPAVAGPETDTESPSSSSSGGSVGLWVLCLLSMSLLAQLAMTRRASAERRSALTRS
jgi:hypothetical protein